MVEVPSYRVEVPLTAALPEQMRASQRSMLGTLHQRVGDEATASAGKDYSRRGWARVIHEDRDIRQAGTVTPHSDGHFNGLQGGTDLWANGPWRVGLYAGQLEGRFDVDGFARGEPNTRTGSTKVRSQYLGGYATWTGEDGLYVDAVLQGARHRFDIEPSGNPRLKGKAKGLTASIEVGKPFEIASGWSIEPQLQLIHERVSVDDMNLGATRVAIEEGRGLTARAGVRIKGEIDTAAGRLMPYARLNVWKTRKAEDTARFSTLAAITPIVTPSGGTSTEAAVGATLALNDKVSLYGELGKSWAAGGDTRTRSSLQGGVGIKVNW